MANEYMQSNVNGAGLVPPHKTRSKATDFSSAGSDFYGGVGPGQAPTSAPRAGGGTAFFMAGAGALLTGFFTMKQILRPIS